MLDQSTRVGVRHRCENTDFSQYERFTVEMDRPGGCSALHNSTSEEIELFHGFPVVSDEEGSNTDCSSGFAKDCFIIELKSFSKRYYVETNQ